MDDPGLLLCKGVLLATALLLVNLFEIASLEDYLLMEE